MRSFLMAGCASFGCLVTTASLAFSADISAKPDSSDPSVAIVTVNGELDEGDGDAFSSAIQGYQHGLVVFSSPGGNLFSGLQIGQIIRTHEFATAVPNGAYCASACALAWLGGAHRFVQGSGLVGFHAAYTVDSSGDKTETGVGNALVGAYLVRLGLSDSAIIYVERADPNDITWLTQQDASSVGIDMAMLPVHAPSNSPSPSSSPTPSAAASNFVLPTFQPLVKAEAGVSPQLVTLIPPRSLSEPLIKSEVTPKQKAAQFVEDYFAHWSESNQEALTYFNSLYSDNVTYYGTSAPRKKIMNEKAAFVIRWPLRIYSVQPNTIHVDCNRDSSACKVTGVVQWDCRSIERDAHSIGTANFDLEIAMEPTGVQVTAESGAVISRQTPKR